MVRISHPAHRQDHLGRSCCDRLPASASASPDIAVKVLARISDGGGHEVHGRRREVLHKRVGSTHGHICIDAYSRLAYSEYAGAENTANRVAFSDDPADPNRYVCG